MSDPITFKEEEFTKALGGDTLKRVLLLLKPHKTKVIIFVLMIALVSIGDAFFTYLTKLVIDKGIAPGSIKKVKEILAVYGLAAIIEAICVFGFIYFAGILGEKVAYDLRKSIFNHIQDLSFSYFDKTPLGWIMSRVTSDTGKISELVTWGLVDTTWGFLNIITSVLFMMMINWRLALVITGILPVMVGAALYFQKSILKYSRLARKQNSRITGSFSEMITGVKIIKALAREKRNLDDFKMESGKMYAASYRAAWYSALFLPVVKIIGAFALGAIIWYGGILKGTGSMTVGGIQAFIFYVAFMLWPIQDLARVWASMQGALASGERIFSLLDTVPEIMDVENPLTREKLKKDIIFKNVTFYYKQDAPVLENFSLTIKRGEKIALVGATGGGKSTIVNLLSRFYEPLGGEILFDGTNYRNFSLESIQSSLGIVLQSPHLFSGTIKENILFGRPGADAEDICRAARLSRAEEFILRMPDGYNSQVGEGGDLLSVGQKQLVCLARGVLSDPDIFIMDEATSSIDPVSEALIQEGLVDVMKGRTSIIVAHRLSTIKMADRILVIDGGMICEEGDHESLLASNGKYSALYRQQFVRS